jgi:hypothetical protein
MCEECLKEAYKEISKFINDGGWWEWVIKHWKNIYLLLVLVIY